MKEKTAEEWAAIFDAHEVWYAPIARFEEVHRDPQALATGAIDTDTDGVPTALVNSPIQFSAGAGMRPQGPAPRHAEHSAQVLRELGLSEEEGERLERQGAFGQPAPPSKL